MLKYIVAVLSAALVAVAGYSFYQRNVVTKQAAAITGYTETIKVNERELKAGAAREKLYEATLKKHRADTAALKAKQKESNERLETALESAKSWADAPVPPAVTEWLRNN